MRVLQFLAVLLTAVYLVPTGAHLFELPPKVGLAEPQYFIVQQIYRGWAAFGVVVIAAMLVNFIVGLLRLRDRVRAWPAFAAGLLLAAALAAFFLWTYPANVATANWTAMPSNWARLRSEWELGHAAAAILTFLALCCAIGSAMAAARRD